MSGNQDFERLVKGTGLREMDRITADILRAPILPERVFIDYHEYDISQRDGEDLRQALLSVSGEGLPTVFKNGIIIGPTRRPDSAIIAEKLYGIIAGGEAPAKEGDDMYFQGNDIMVSTVGGELEPMRLPEDFAVCARLIGAACTTYFKMPEDAMDEDAMAEIYWGGVALLVDARIVEASGYGTVVQEYDGLQVPIDSRSISWGLLPHGVQH